MFLTKKRLVFFASQLFVSENKFLFQEKEEKKHQTFVSENN